MFQRNPFGKNTIILSVSVTALLLQTGADAFAQGNHRVQAKDKTLTGMTAGGGTHGYGVAYHYNTQTGHDTVPINTIEYQAGGTPYGMPRGSTLLLANNGLLYGMSQFGGLFGMGSIFSFDPVSGKDSLRSSFTWTNGYSPRGPLMQASNGLIYGMAQWGGSAGLGVLFYYNPVTGQDSVMINFNGTNGTSPYYSKLVQAPNGKLYGMTEAGGTFNHGVLFSFDPVAQTESVLVNFNDSTGKNPSGGLMLASDGNLYGTCTFGGGIANGDSGTLFRFNPTGNVFTLLYKLRSITGGLPYGNLMQASNGLLYGLCSSGGTNSLGTMYCFNYNTLKDSVLVNFNGIDGAIPNGDNDLIQATNGLLYGTTFAGGNLTNPYGVLFSYNPVNGKDTILVNFTNGNVGGNPGSYPFDAVVEVPASGILYGLTQQGGAFMNGGTVFKYDLNTSTYGKLADLGGSSSNEGCLMEATNGMLYGITAYGGNNSLGTIFQYDPNTYAVSILHQFAGTDGLAPYSMLFQANDGNLYGTTSHGDTNINGWGDFFGAGVLFKYNPSGNLFTYLHNFGVGTLTGKFPLGALMQASDNNLYGTTLKGGAHNVGTLYSFNPTTLTDSVVISFNDTDGANPVASSVLQANNKLLYGMTLLGGSNNMGVLYYYNLATRKDSVLFSFTGANGAFPFADLLQNSVDNNIYGLTSKGGTSNDGVIFRFNPITKQDTVVLNFSGANGTHPYRSTLIQDSAGIMYGTTRFGGTHNEGVLFSFDPITKLQSILLNFSADSGEYPCNLLFVNGATQGAPALERRNDIVLIYPNPFRTAATVVFGDNGAHIIEVDNMQGEKINTLSAAGKQCEIPRNNLALGMYFLKIFDGNGSYQSTSKIMVQ